MHTCSRNQPLSQSQDQGEHRSCKRTGCTAILVFSWFEASCRLHVTAWMAPFLDYRVLPLGMRRGWLATIRTMTCVRSGGNSLGAQSLFGLWPKSAVGDQIFRDINSLLKLLPLTMLSSCVHQHPCANDHVAGLRAGHLLSLLAEASTAILGHMLCGSWNPALFQREGAEGSVMQPAEG